MKIESTDPVLYPMGVYTFAFACAHCANRNSSKCFQCKNEEKSGFEPKKEATMKIEFTVPGIPVGKGRPRFTRSGHAYTPDATKAYEEKVRICWKTQSGQGFSGGIPVVADIVAYFPVPKSAGKRKSAAMEGTFHLKKTGCGQPL